MIEHIFRRRGDMMFEIPWIPVGNHKIFLQDVACIEGDQIVVLHMEDFDFEQRN